MSMRCRSHLARLLPLLVVALALMLAVPDAAGAPQRLALPSRWLSRVRFRCSRSVPPLLSSWDSPWPVIARRSEPPTRAASSRT